MYTVYKIVSLLLLTTGLYTEIEVINILFILIQKVTLESNEKYENNFTTIFQNVGI